MLLVTTNWLVERGGLHDARVLGVHHSGSVIELDLDDEWANERGLGRPEGATTPGTMIIALTGMPQSDLGAYEGGWVSEVELSQNELRLTFCDRDALVLSTNSVTWTATD